MSMTREEAAYEEAMEALYAEHKEQAIEEFRDERLQSYYIANPLIAESPSRFLSQSRILIGNNPTAAFLFAAIAIEVGLKVVLLKPVIYGLVHNESFAGIIADTVMAQSGYQTKFRELLLNILSVYGGVDLNKFKRTETQKLLWTEISEVQKRRNGIMHRAEIVADEEAQVAVAVASAILEELFPSVVKKLGFHLHDAGRVCNDYRCNPTWLEFKKEGWSKF